MDAPTLRRFLNIRDDALFARFFAAFDTDRNGTVDEAEFLVALGAVMGADDRAKLRFIYDLHDTERRGYITRPDFTRFIESAIAEARLDFTKKQVNDLVWLLFRTADTDQNGSISFEEFAGVLEGYQDKHGSISLDLSRWIAPLPARKLKRAKIRRPPLHRRIRSCFQLGDPTFFYLMVYVTANIVLFMHAMNTYAAAGANLAVQIARGCGACLNFNGALILVPVMRNLLTWLRGTFAAHLIPLDEHLEFHKLVGQVMFAFALVHTGAHLYNYSLTEHTIQWHLTETMAGLSGAILLAVFAVMWLGAQAFIRRGGWFEVFAVTHTLYFAWFGLMLWHGPRFWKWFWLPGAAYLLERVTRARHHKFRTKIVNVQTYPSGVTNLQIERPEGFDYRPADYMFVRVPAVSRFEWHPFTISSSPDDPMLGLHVRSLGNWSRALFSRMLHFQERRTAFRPMPIVLDGPYGTPSTHIFQSTHAVLIAAGIGATPFASILRTIQLRRLKAEPMSLRKVHFIWLAGDQISFEWFLRMLAEIEASDARDLIDIQIYMTEFKRDLKTFTLDLAIDLLAAQGRTDLVTGLRAKTKFGRPDWNEVFANLSQEHVGHRVDVFFCGPPGLGAGIRPYCHAAGFRFRREIF
jgi:Ca2+-binding EF-hand superfamily protein